MKVCHSQKETNANKLEINRSKKNLEVVLKDRATLNNSMRKLEKNLEGMQKNWLVLKDRVNGLEVTLGMRKEWIEDLEEDLNIEKDLKRRKDQKNKNAN